MSRYDEDNQIFGGALIVILCLMALTLMATSCTTTKYVPVETVKTEYVAADTTAIYNRILNRFEAQRKEENRYDSLFDRMKETVVIRENGDTARHDRERIIYRVTHREKELEYEVAERDSVINSLRLQLSTVKTDSVAVPYPVEKELTRWQQTKQDWGGTAMGLLAIGLSVAAVWLARKFRR